MNKNDNKQPVLIGSTDTSHNLTEFENQLPIIVAN